MAVSSSSWFNNGIAGQPQVGADVDITESHSTPRFAIGQRYTRSDGSVFAYSHFGADTSQGKLCSQDVSESAKNDGDLTIISPASSVSLTDGNTGTRFIEATVASVTADQFAGGYLVITDGTGEGYCRRIKGNTATGNPASGNIRIEIYEPWATIVHGSSATCAIVGSKYANLEASSYAASPSDVIFAGISCSNMDVSEASYGWVQVEGPCAVLTQGTIIDGKDAFVSTSTAGAITGTAVNVTKPVGYCLKHGADTEYSVIDLFL